MEVPLVLMEEKTVPRCDREGPPPLPSPRTAAEDSGPACLISVQNRLHFHCHAIDGG